MENSETQHGLLTWMHQFFLLRRNMRYALQNLQVFQENIKNLERYKVVLSGRSVIFLQFS